MKLIGALAEKGFHESGNGKHTHGGHDLTNLSENDIRDHLKDVVWFRD